MNEKRVILFIMEGTSDKISFQSILENFFNSSTVKVAVMYGDVTLSEDAQPGTIKSIMSSKITDFCQREKIKFPNDIKAIVHLIDTDGVYIPSELVKEKEIPHIEYTEEEIFTSSPQKIRNRNSNKAVVVNKLYSMNNLNKIPYKVFYFSRNLEHVLHNRGEDLTDNEKRILSEEFDDKYADNLKAFIEFINNSVFAVSGNYNYTWDFIKKGNNSLNRYCNFHLLFKQN